MKQLTFKGFLKNYLIELSKCESSSINKLCEEVNSNLRLLEPLVLYIKITTTLEQQKRIKNELVNDKLCELYNISDVEKALKNNLLSDDFQKVYNSYLVKTKKKENDNRIKQLLLQKIKQIQKEKHISNYRIYTDLRLNQGNINDYLKNENVDRLSLDTANRIFEYVLVIA